MSTAYLILADGTVYYRLTEIQTPNKYQLLEEPLVIGTLPQTADPTLDISLYDVNGDGAADDADLVLLDRAIGGRLTLPSGRGDIDGSGAVDRGDRQLLQAFLTESDTPYNRKYAVEYSVTNGSVFELPSTGSAGFAYMPLAVVCLVPAVTLLRRRRRA